MQHLGATARYFLRLVVVERLQQPRVGHGARIRGEHSRHVRPDLEPTRGELGRQVTGRRVGAAPPEQDRVALLVARDEALRDEHAPGPGQAALQRGIGLEATGRGKVAGTLRGTLPRVGVQELARVEPVRIEAFTLQERGAEPGRHQLAGRHHPRAQAIAHLADQLYPCRGAPQLREMPFELGEVRHGEIAREIAVPLLDLRHDRFPVAAQRLVEQLLEPVRDSGQRRVHEHRVQAVVQACPDDVRDAPPVADAGDARAAELQHDPGGIGIASH